MFTKLPAVDEYRLVGLVWRCLDKAPDERPTVGQLAGLLGRSERQLRREWRRGKAWRAAPSLRVLVGYACLEYAWIKIHSGVKCVAASRLAGFHSHWNFNRQTKQFAAGTARTCRDLVLLQFDPSDVARAVSALDAEIRALEGRKEGRKEQMAKGAESCGTARFA